MIELIDFKETRFDCTDVSDLQSLLKQLLGQPFQFFRVSYGDELRLHLGDLQGYSNPRMRDRTKGSYIVAARASSWFVYSTPRHMMAASDASELKPDRVDVKTIETGGFVTPGSIVTRVLVNGSGCGISLRLSFSDGSIVNVLPTSETSEFVPEEASGAREISDWEILTPHDRVLRVGPGARWDYVDSSTKRGE